MAAVSDCPLCGGTGWQQTEKNGVAGVVRCECSRQDRTSRLMAEARIPRRYEHCELAEFNASGNHSLAQAKLNAERFVDEYPMSPPLGLLFMGAPGIGKTHLAVGIVKRLIREKNVACLFRTFPELLKEIQNTYNPRTQASELSLLAPVLDTEVLVLDELGAQNPSSWVRDTVGYILNYRYNENDVTLATTNFLDVESKHDPRRGVDNCLVDRIGDRMRSRLYEMCKTVTMAGADFRLKVRHADHHF